MTLSARELSLLSNTDVLGYVQAQNAELSAQAKAEGWAFWTTMPECVEFLAEYANVYELELSFARGAYADSYKDWCGIKGYVSDHLTLEQVEAEVDQLSKWANEAYEAEQAWLAEQDRLAREEIALGLAEPTPETELEAWEIWEARAEEEGC